MRKILLILSVVFLNIVPKLSVAQNIRGVAISGFNLCQVDGDRLYGFNRLGANIGVGAIIPLGGKFSIHLETIYSQKGSFQGIQRDDSLSNGSYKLILDYLEVPVYANFYDPKGKMNIGMGFSWGRLARFEEYRHGFRQEYAKADIPYHSDDINWFVNFYIRVWSQLQLNFRYSYSLVKIRDKVFSDGEWRKQYNNFVTLRLMWVLGKEK
ncbi:MAG: PorT family protein [Bacteroidetes bacterium]|nr:PorT family protein [Bacteroidota bacterium]MBU1718214.1 PorT family protein [Bacteroidota bacterium]